MRVRHVVTHPLLALATSAIVLAQAAPTEIDTHIAAAKAAAGQNFRGTFMNLCLPGAPRGGGPGAPNRGAGPARGAGAPGAAAPARGAGGRGVAPDAATWYASP